MNPTPAKDGFDSLEYPCEFMFKAMCRRIEGSEPQALVVDRITRTVSAEAIVSSKTKPSRTGKFESVSVVVKINSRAQLEEIYQHISALDFVEMTL